MRGADFINKDIIITDPCYIANRNDWGTVFDWNTYKISNSNFTNYLWDYTGRGDGSWEVIGLKEILNRVELEKFIDGFETSLNNFSINDLKSREELRKYIEKSERLGRFSVDSGTFGVFCLDEVLKYDPTFLRDHGIWLYTIINNFTGTIQIQNRENNFNILGLGNKTFCSII
jgi:hypothetical protein